MLTPKQAERLREKIKKLKAALASDKKYWGGYHHDGQGLRYSILKLYVQLEDYKGGQRYLNWFIKNFPDDDGYPDFLFEWTIILFMNGKTREAEKKLFETFTRNNYLVDKFLGNAIVPIDKWEGSNLETPDFTSYFKYSSTDPGLTNFSEWLTAFVSTDKFKTASEKFVELEKKLNNENDYEKRSYLVDHQQQLIDSF